MKSGGLIQLGEDITAEPRYDHSIVISGRAKRQNTSIIPEHLNISGPLKQYHQHFINTDVDKVP